MNNICNQSFAHFVDQGLGFDTRWTISDFLMKNERNLILVKNPARRRRRRRHTCKTAMRLEISSSAT
jgi:hypothetical protein